MDFKKKLIVSLKRCRENPILTANKKRTWEAGAVFNPGAVLDEKGIVHLLYRAVKSGYYKKPGYGFVNYISVIGHATSKDGIHFKARRKLINVGRSFDKLGCEDPRVTKLGKEFFITYTALSQKGFRPALASTKDFSKVKKYGLIGPDINNKDVVIFPEKINGKIAVLLRIEPNIQIVYFDDLMQLKSNHSQRFWKDYMKNLDGYIVLKRKYRWEAMKIGAGPPPIKTNGGWLLIYHGVDKRKVYRAGAALLDFDNPQKVICRTAFPILEPKMRYERIGDVVNIVFPTGAFVKDEEVFVYYGAADKSCCLATCNLKRLLSHIKFRGG